MQEDDTFAAALKRAMERPETIAMMDQAQAFVRDFTKILEDWMEQLKPGLLQLGDWFDESVQKPYEQVGSPYGEGPAALIQWFREQHQQNGTGQP